MKKYVLHLLIIVMLLSFFSCSNKNTNKNGNESTISPTESIISTASPCPTADNSSEKGDTDEDENITLEDVLNHPVTPESDFQVREKDEGCCEIVSYSGSDSIVVIPETIKELKVIGIKYKAFYRDKQILALKLSDSIEYIGYEAFKMSEIKYLICGINLTKIDTEAFFDCKELSEVILKDNIQWLGVSAFAGCKQLKSIYIPQSATEIMSFVAMNEDFTIYGVAGSRAESYAAEDGYKFVPVS